MAAREPPLEPSDQRVITSSPAEDAPHADLLHPLPPRTRRLVDAFLERKPKAERELVAAVHEIVLRELKHNPLWRSRLRRRYEEEDAVGELWKRVLDGQVLERFEWRHTGSLAAEIRRILECQLHDMSRRLMADKRGNGEDPLPLDAVLPDGRALRDPPARDRTPSTQAWTNEAHAWVFQRLRTEQRRVLELHLRESTQPEISQALGLPLSAVRKAIARIGELYRRYAER